MPGFAKPGAAAARTSKWIYLDRAVRDPSRDQTGSDVPRITSIHLLEI